MNVKLNRWQKGVVAAAILVALVLGYRNPVIWLAVIAIGGLAVYERVRSDRPAAAPDGTPLPTPSEELAAKRAARPHAERRVKTAIVVGGVVISLAFLWVLPYLIAVATLGEACPWTPPGITSPDWKC